MPYSTSNNPGMAQAANAIAKIFVGDPVADAEWKNQQIKNETEYQRQKLLAEQTITEGTQRKQIEAAAAANNALAAGRSRENSAHNDLGTFFTQFQPQQLPAGVAGPPAPPKAQFNLNDPAQAARIAEITMRGGIDPKNLGAMALMPGQGDDALARIFTAGGQTIGKDDYVSINDRNTNRNYELGAGERLVGGDGAVRAGVDASYSDAQGALANQRNATAGRQNALAAAGGGGKVPRLDQSQMNSMLLNAILSQGAQIPRDDKGNYSMGASQYLSPQPELYQDMSRLIDESYRLSGGRASAVQDALAQYLNGMDFKNFQQSVGGSDFIPFNERVETNPMQRPDLNALLARIQQMYGPNAFAPEIFTEGGEGDLPNLQNVGKGNGSWQVIGVE